MMSMRPSGKSSATIAATLEVPMSRATMRFLFSLAMSDSLARAGLGENGQLGVTLPAEKLSISIYELQPSSLPPARERYVFFDAHFQVIWPAAPQFGSAHPGNPLEQRAHRLQVDGKKSALDAVLERADDLVAH